MKKISIAIVAGGDSSEKEISISGAEFILSQLSKDKFDAKIVVISKQKWFVKNESSQYEIDKNDFSYINNGQKHTFDFAIIIIHGTPGENGIIQSYFELISIPYSTGGVPSSANSFDKEFCKKIVKDKGIKIAKEIVIKAGDKIDSDKIVSELSLPMFIKPNASGSSFGVTKVKEKADIIPAINSAFKESDIVLIEEMITGREVSCGIFITKEKEYILPITEIVTQRDFFDYMAKYEGHSQEITPAELPEIVVKRLNEATSIIYKELRCRGVVRVDFIIDKNGIPYMIEVNNIPGMSPKSIIPQQISHYGMSVAQMYELIISDILN